MNKNAIQKFAIWARNELIAQVSQRAYQYGITKEGCGEANAVTVGGRALTGDEQKQRKELVDQIRSKGYTQVMEEVAYTWFNRFIALRFMEVNNYLPSHIRVFSDASGAFKPEILNDVLHLDLPGLDSGKVAEYIESNDTEALYRYLLLTQCNALNSALPVMFERMGGYTEMLLPNNILRQDSVLGHMVSDIPEEDWQDAVQIIGWLYQYYNTELKDDTFAQLKKNVKITKERIPAATQLFTPDWIVRYMVENSLGRLWLEGHPNAELHDGWKYYLDEAEQEPEVEAQLAKLREEYKSIKPEEIKVIDPCMGSGHILVYAFDVLMQIYTSAGWDQREAAQSILKNNLYGLDIDDRAAQLAYFAVMMKARQYDRRLFTRSIQPNIFSIRESNGIQAMTIEYFHKNDPKLKADIESILTEMRDAKEYGSILNITPVDFDGLYARFDENRSDINNIMQMTALDELLPVVKCAEVLAQKYDVVVTNPPYMAVSNAGAKVNDYVKKNFPDSKADLFAVFIERCGQMANLRGFYSLITQPSLVSLSSFEGLRRSMLSNGTFITMLHMGRGIFGIDFGSLAFVSAKKSMPEYTGHYFKLHKRTFQYIEPNDIRRIYLVCKEKQETRLDFDNYDTKTGLNPALFTRGENVHFLSKQSYFQLVPGTPLAYWLSKRMIDSFKNKSVGDFLVTREGMATADNDRFLRLWQEIPISQICFGCHSQDDAGEMKWFPYNKGGEYRKWYGNNDLVVDWKNEGYAIRNNIDPKTGRIRSHNYNGEFAFRRGITWSSISAGDISVRYAEDGFLFDSKGAKGFCENDQMLYPIQALINSVVAKSYLKVFSPTMDFKVGDIVLIPLYEKLLFNEPISALTKDSVSLSQIDWDAYETSWDFKRNPLI